MKKQKRVVWIVEVLGKAVPKSSLAAAERDAEFYKKQGLKVGRILKRIVS